MTACLYFWIKSSSTWSFIFTSFCIYVTTCIQTLKFMYDSWSACQWRHMLWSSGLWHHVAWYTNINNISEEHTASMFKTKTFLEDSSLRKYFKIFTSQVSSLPLPDNHSQKSPMWYTVYLVIYNAATIWYWQRTV